MKLKEDIENFAKRIVIDTIDESGVIEGGRLQQALNNTLSKVFNAHFPQITIDSLGIVQICCEENDGSFYHIIVSVKDTMYEFFSAQLQEMRRKSYNEE